MNQGSQITLGEFKFEEQQINQVHDFAPATVELFHRVVHKPSGYYFSFYQFLVRYTPGATELHADERCINWPDQLHAVDNWLSNLVREVETPDLWAALSQEKELLGT